MDSNAWLEELKEGDPVYVEERQYSQCGYFKTTVKRVTQTGRIKVYSPNGKYEHDFNPDGAERGAGQWNTLFRTLVPYTPENIKMVADLAERMALLKRISHANWDFYALDQLRRIDAILKEPAPIGKE